MGHADLSLLAAVAIVFAWMWLPGVTFPVFRNWLAENNALFANPANFALLSNVMGLVPIGALDRWRFHHVDCAQVGRKGGNRSPECAWPSSAPRFPPPRWGPTSTRSSWAASSWASAFPPPWFRAPRACRSGSLTPRAAAPWPSGRAGRPSASSCRTSSTTRFTARCGEQHREPAVGLVRPHRGVRHPVRHLLPRTAS